MTEDFSLRGLLVSGDLFFASKVTGTAGAVGLRIDIVADPQTALEQIAEAAPYIVLLDLATPGLEPAEFMSAVENAVSKTADRPRVIAFGAHVQKSLLESARQAGCDEVLPRSRFSAELPEILQRART